MTDAEESALLRAGLGCLMEPSVWEVIKLNWIIWVKPWGWKNKGGEDRRTRAVFFNKWRMQTCWNQGCCKGKMKERLSYIANHIKAIVIYNQYLPVSEGRVWFSTAMDVPHPMMVLLASGHESLKSLRFSSSFSMQKTCAKK